MFNSSHHHGHCHDRPSQSQTAQFGRALFNWGYATTPVPAVQFVAQPMYVPPVFAPAPQPVIFTPGMSGTGWNNSGANYGGHQHHNHQHHKPGC
jgi:hypothetical protein